MKNVKTKVTVRKEPKNVKALDLKWRRMHAAYMRMARTSMFFGLESTISRLFANARFNGDGMRQDIKEYLKFTAELHAMRTKLNMAFDRRSPMAMPDRTVTLILTKVLAELDRAEKEQQRRDAAINKAMGSKAAIKERAKRLEQAKQRAAETGKPVELVYAALVRGKWTTKVLTVKPPKGKAKPRT